MSVFTNTEILAPAGIRSPGRSTHTNSLYRLSYRGLHFLPIRPTNLTERPFKNTLSLCMSFHVRDQVSHPYETTDSNYCSVNSNLCTFREQTVTMDGIRRPEFNVGLQLSLSLCLSVCCPIKIVVLGESTTCSLVKAHRRFRGTLCCANGYQPTVHHDPLGSDQQRNLSRICE